MVTILGIDPGSRRTGYGVIASDGFRYRYVTSGHIAITANCLSEKLHQIYEGVNHLISEHLPQQAAIETVFVCHNVASALKLGQARGAAMVALASRALSVAEYSPRKIKKAVVGYGGADKLQIAQMVQRLLKLSDLPQADAADALAIALCHAHTAKELCID